MGVRFWRRDGTRGAPLHWESHWLRLLDECMDLLGGAEPTDDAVVGAGKGKIEARVVEIRATAMARCPLCGIMQNSEQERRLHIMRVHGGAPDQDDNNTQHQGAPDAGGGTGAGAREADNSNNTTRANNNIYSNDGGRSSRHSNSSNNNSSSSSSSSSSSRRSALPWGWRRPPATASGGSQSAGRLTSCSSTRAVGVMSVDEAVSDQGSRSTRAGSDMVVCGRTDVCAEKRRLQHLDHTPKREDQPPGAD
jgi:hypothetical protein